MCPTMSSLCNELHGTGRGLLDANTSGDLREALLGLVAW